MPKGGVNKGWRRAVRVVLAVGLLLAALLWLLPLGVQRAPSLSWSVFVLLFGIPLTITVVGFLIDGELPGPLRFLRKFAYHYADFFLDLLLIVLSLPLWTFNWLRALGAVVMGIMSVLLAINFWQLLHQGSTDWRELAINAAVFGVMGVLEGAAFAFRRWGYQPCERLLDRLGKRFEAFKGLLND